MKLNEWINQQIPAIADELNEINKQHFDIENSIGFTGRDKIYEVLHKLQEVLFPGIYTYKPLDETRVQLSISHNLSSAAIDLRVSSKGLYV